MEYGKTKEEKNVRAFFIVIAFIDGYYREKGFLR